MSAECLVSKCERVVVVVVVVAVVVVVVAVVVRLVFFCRPSCCCGHRFLLLVGAVCISTNGLVAVVAVVVVVVLLLLLLFVDVVGVVGVVGAPGRWPEKAPAVRQWRRPKRGTQGRRMPVGCFDFGISFSLERVIPRVRRHRRPFRIDSCLATWQLW